ESTAVELVAVPELDGGHDLIARVLVGHAVHRREHDVGVPADGGLDRAGGEVLAVDSEPVRGSTREVEEAILVDVPEVTRPVPAAPERRVGGFRVVVIALEGAGPG